MKIKANRENTLPEINYDEFKGTLDISGRAVSPEVVEHFEKFLPYFEKTLNNDPTDLNVTIDIEYYSTKMSRIFLDLFYIIKREVAERGKLASIEWIVEEGDEDLHEAAMDYKELTDLNIFVTEKPE